MTSVQERYKTRLKEPYLASYFHGGCPYDGDDLEIESLLKKNFAKYIVSKINIFLTKFFFDRKMDFRVRKSYSWSGSRTSSIAVGIGLKKKPRKWLNFRSQGNFVFIADHPLSSLTEKPKE